MIEIDRNSRELIREMEDLRRRVQELEDSELQRVSDEQDRFDSLQVLDEYAKQLEESRDNLMRLFKAAVEMQEAKSTQVALEKVAAAMKEAGWGSVSVALYDNFEIVQSAYAGCSTADIEFLETHRRPAVERARMYSSDFDEFKISRSYFVPAERIEEVMSLENVCPGRREVQPGDEWDPMDLAYVPLYGSHGTVIGSINCDDPVDGKRPTREVFFYLELFAEFAAYKVETARLIEQQQRAEEELRIREERFRSVFENSPIGMTISGSDGRYLNVNRAICEMLGYSADELINKSFAEVTHPEDISESFTALHRFTLGECDDLALEKRYVHKDGHTVWASINIGVIHNHATGSFYVVSQVQDITERKRAELERETIVHILQIANASSRPDEMVDQIFAEVGKLVPATNRFLAIYDPEKEQISFPYFVDEMDAPPPPVSLGKGLTSWVIRNGRPLRLAPEDFERLSQTGEILLLGSPAMSWLGVPLTTNSGVVGALVVQSYHSNGSFDANHERVLSAVASQIASVIERQRFEEDTMKFKRAVQTSGDVIFMTDAKGTFTYANPEFSRLYGYSTGEVVGKATPRIIKSGTLTPGIYEDVWRRLTNGEIVKGEIVNKTKDGRLVTVEGSANPILDESGRIIGYLGTQRDVTERKATELRIARLNECFLSFTADPVENINRLVAVCGELLGASMALYNCLIGDQLCAIGHWHTPENMSLAGKAEGRVCAETIRGRDDLVLIRDLTTSKFAESDPNISQSDMQTYIGMVVKCGEQRVGALCVLYDRDIEPSEEVTRFMGIIASAIGVEEVQQRAIAALKESDLRFRILADTVPVMIWLSNADKRLIYVNRCWLDFTGRQLVEEKGDGWFSNVHPEDMQRVRSTYRMAFDRQIDFSIQFRLKRKDGFYCWVLANGRPRQTTSGRFVGYIGTVTDITEQLKKEREEADRAE